MKILRRYCGFELIFPTLMSLLLFTFIFMVGHLVKLADLLVNKGVSLWDVIVMLLLAVPSVFGFILPTSVLASILLTFGGFAQNNEITAMKASGVNIVKVMIPVIAAAFLLSIFSLFLVDQIEPYAQYTLRQMTRQMVVKRPTAYIEAERFIKDFEGYVMWVNKVEGKRLEGIRIYEPQEKGPARTILAEAGEIIPSEDELSLSIKLFNGTSDEPNPDDPSILYKLNFETFTIPNLTLGKASGGKGKKPREMMLDELLYRLKHDKSISQAPKEKRVLRAEINKRIAFAFATFVFAMIGLPAAIITRRGEAVVSFTIAMSIVAIYYVCFAWMRTLAVSGSMPPEISLWLPNIVMVLVSIFLFRRAVY
ncbi:MAG: hypothetical protein A3G33_11410 [Omnitrophica bacterium RIFCSPLOWO2_12_FULL_44_17]|uniref:Lipopolysaccharide export system permease protein LptF n=1 Tax=Candidatus Danuiimicrobium aquiferis TaxID=1801832 RepID=A0A1G1KRS2_9BACT|nr:MAG: hypothetical protein A3B72_09245 [Omnitrophica bacterium RIFCSPHIGHO2_02_FULL_45_28]OGW95597.1 MAG: hypothetical protein A3G33_11410 [Omnitrophica bacterium RIFCSPLOWO2_12_FULL_44_17]OGX03688.1 MAG: hypothetical protein A3J12_01080 [Omnitrophica bacterium RIFCSPLOWO2_02_FULL_44_11]